LPENKFTYLRKAVIQEIIHLIREKYVYPEIGELVAAQIQANLEEGTYDHIATHGELAAKLTVDLQELSKDHHWAVVYDPQTAVELIDPEEEQDERHLERYLDAARSSNFGFERLERMKGNIGYLELHTFEPAEYAGETVAAAMNFLANCDALILDLRQCHGGYPSTVQLLTSYLVDEKPRHINTFYYRPTDDTQQFWTFPHVPGKRRPDIPLYVLISSATGSGGEEIAYNFKHMQRATLIGKTTVGAAHPVTREVVGGVFVVRLPYGRPINPITGTNWEGTGVEPHIAVPAEEALKTAQLAALEHLLENAQDAGQRRQLEWVAEIIDNEYHPVELAANQVEAFAGEYGKRLFTIQDGVLFAGHQDFPVSWPLIPMSATRFRLDEDMKLEFILDEDKAVSSVRIWYRDGRPDVTEGKTG
jgi:hypothetical protein